MIELGLNKSITYTTRPKREGEVDGDVYHFISNEKFNEMIENNEFYEYDVFLNDWYYGSTKEDWENCNLFIKTVKGVNSIREEDRKGCFVVYLDIDEGIRYERLMERNDNNDSSERRIQSDKRDFNYFDNFDLRIRDEKFSPKMVYDLMS